MCSDIVAAEKNPERKAFYQLAWYLGASQSDLAFLNAEDVDLENRAISFARKKTGSIALLRFGDGVAEILSSLPSSGPLFPYLRRVRPSDRATEFKQRCKAVGIIGVTLHSYRYAWAERAKQCGYPERFAQEALGHNSKAVHRAYARKAKMELPSLEEFQCQRSEFKQTAAVKVHPAETSLAQKLNGLHWSKAFYRAARIGAHHFPARFLEILPGTSNKQAASTLRGRQPS